MFFIIIMDALNLLISKASEWGLLHPILRRANGQRISLYADDVVMFLHQQRDELALVKEVLNILALLLG
jgi:hypothetical protein